MTTTVIKTLGNGGSANGYDYGDFNAFAAAVPANLVTADQQWILEVDSTHGEISLSSAQSISGKTTDATRNIIIRAKAGKSFSDHASKTTNALRYNASNGAAITNSSNNGWGIVHDFSSVERIEGVQLRGTSSSPHTLLATGGDIYGSIIECATSAYTNSTIIARRAINSVIYAVANTGYQAFLIKLPWDIGANSRLSGSTLFSFDSGFTAILQPGGGVPVKGCAIFGFGTLYSNDGSGGAPVYEGSATNLGAMAGTGNVTSLTASAQFENVAALGTLDLRVKTGSSLINAGIRDQTYTNDKDALKQTRSTITPTTIGAFEYGAASGNSSPTFPGPNIGNQTGTVGTALTNNNIASKFSDTDALTFSAIGTWPAGVTVSSVGVISGTPTTAGTYASLKVRATDTAAQTVDSDTFSFTISAAADTTVPTLTGSITISALTTTSYTASWPSGSDNVAVTGYQYRIAGSSWVNAGNVLSVGITGRTPGATESFEVRAYDAATNYSTPALSTSVTLNGASVGTIQLPLLGEWETNNLLPSQSGITVWINNEESGEFVLKLTGVTTAAVTAAFAPISHASLVAGTAYSVRTRLASGAQYTWTYAAS